MEGENGHPPPPSPPLGMQLKYKILHKHGMTDV